MHKHKNCKAFFPGIDPGAPVDVKQGNLLDMGGFSALKRVEHRLATDVVTTTTAISRRTTGSLDTVFAVRKRLPGERLLIDLEDDWRAGQLELAHEPRMQLADPSRRFAVDQHARRAAGVQRRVGCRFGS